MQYKQVIGLLHEENVFKTNKNFFWYAWKNEDQYPNTVIKGELPNVLVLYFSLRDADLLFRLAS